jgi:response regulator RpfG family c-di-GMP phosphodiesterase
MSAKAKILIIDDDPDLCAALSEGLTADGYRVICASQGSQGLELMRDERPDLVFLDVIMRMPTEGVWVSQEIARDPVLRSIPVVMLTSIVDSEYSGHFPTDRPLHAHMFLDKPVPMKRILEIAGRFTGRNQVQAAS